VVNDSLDIPSDHFVEIHGKRIKWATSLCNWSLPCDICFCPNKYTYEVELCCILIIDLVQKGTSTSYHRAVSSFVELKVNLQAFYNK